MAVILLLSNRVMDLRSDFSTDVATNGRRDVSLDVQWDPNRNPQKKFVLKTSFEPSNLNSDDWTSAVILSYPGSYVRGNLAALTNSKKKFSEHVLLQENLTAAFLNAFFFLF